MRGNKKKNYDTPFKIFLSIIPTRSPLALKAVAMKIPNVPPQTMTSNVASHFLKISDWLNKLAIFETTGRGSSTTVSFF